MAFNRELSQFANYLELDAAGQYIGISSTSDTNVGIGTATPESKLTVEGDALVSGMVTATGNFSGDLYGTADFAIDAHGLTTARTITLAGDINGSVAFDGTQDVVINTTIQPDSLVLGDDTEGNFVQDVVAGSSNIEVTGSGSEKAVVTVDLSDTTVSAGSYGSVSNIPTFTVDAKGRLTEVIEVPISTTLKVTADNNFTDEVNLIADTLDVEGGANVTTTVTDNKVTVDLDADIALTSIDLSGTLDVTGDTTLQTLDAQTSTLDSVSVTTTAAVGTDLTVGGNSVVDGTSQVKSDAQFDSNVAVAGNTTLTGTLDVTAKTTVGELDAQASTLNSLSVTTNAAVTGTLDVTGDTTVQTLSAQASTLDTAVVTKTADVGTNLTVGGTATVDGNLRTKSDATVDVDLSVGGDTTLTGALGVTGDTTLQTLTAQTTALDSLSVATDAVVTGDVSAARFITGAEGQSIIVEGTRITGPSTITLDPAGIGDETGTVFILGDLQVRGSQTIIDSTAVSVADLNIIVAKGAANDAAANGAGLTVESGADAANHKTFQYEAAPEKQNFASSENLNLASGKVYKIDNVEVLSATTLGGTVVNSSLTSVGTLVDLTVAGDVAFGSDLSVDGATTLTGLLTAGDTDLQRVDVTDDVTVGTTLTVAGATSLSTLGTSGLATLNSASVTTSLAVGGTSVMTGAVTMSDTLIVAANTTLSSDLEVGGDAAFNQAVDVTGATTLSTLATSGLATLAAAQINGIMAVSGASSLNGPVATGDTLDVTGAATLDSTLDVTGATTLTTLNATGAAVLDSTLRVKSAAQFDTTVDVTGDTTVGGITTLQSTLNVAGAASFDSTIVAGANVTAPTFTGDLIGNADTATAQETERKFSIGLDGSGDASAPQVAYDATADVDLTMTLRDVNAAPGTHGSATEIPIITTNAKGLVLDTTVTAVGTSLSVAADAGADETIEFLTEKLTISGADHLTTTTLDNEVSVSIDATPANTASTVVSRDANGDFAANAITAPNFHGLADRATKLETARAIDITGDGVAGAISFDGTADKTLNFVLNNVNPTTTGQFGDRAHVSQITVNAKGLITNVTNVAISTSISLGSDDAGAGVVDPLTQNLSVLGSDYIATQVSGTDFTISLKGTAANEADKAVVRDASGDFAARNITATGEFLGNATTATDAFGLTEFRKLELDGDVKGDILFDGTADVIINTTIQPNSIELATDTVGNYVATLADMGQSDIIVNASGTEDAAVTVGLTTTGVVAGSYGTKGNFPVIEVDDRGRVLSMGTTSVSTVLNMTADSGSDDVDLLDDVLNIEGGTNVTTTVSDNNIKVDLDPVVDVATSVTAPTFITTGEANAIAITSDTIAGPEVFYLDPNSDDGPTGKIVIKGDLEIRGTTNTVNSTEVEIGDHNIILNAAGTTDSQADGGGITIKGAVDKTFVFDALTSSFKSSENINTKVGKVYKIGGTEVLSSTTLGAGVINSSLETVATISTGVWEATPINDLYIDTIDNANKVQISALDIDAGTEVGSPIADDDLMILDSGANGTNVSMKVDRMPVYTFSKVHGDILIDAAGLATVQPDSVALGTDTTGVFVKSISDSGNNDIVVVDGAAEDGNDVTLTLTETGVAPAIYGSTTEIPFFQVDSKGRIVSAGSTQVDTTLDVSSDIGSFTVDQQTAVLSIEGFDGELKGVASNGVVVLGLEPTGVTSTSYGSKSQVPVLDIDSKGRIMSATTTEISEKLTVTGDTGSSDVNLLTSSLAIEGDSTYIDSLSDSDTVSLSIRATSANTADMIVARDSNGDFSAQNITANLLSADVESVGISTFNEFRVNTKIYDSTGASGGEKQTIGIDVATGNLIWQDLTDILPATRTTDSRTATEGQTDFAFTYNPNYLDVFVNGVKLNTNEVTAADGFNVKVLEPLFEGDVVEFHSYATAGGGLGVVDALSDLSDVALAASAEGQVLAFNGTQYVNVSSVDLPGSVTAASITSDADITATAAVNAASAVISGNLSAGSLTLSGDAAVTGNIVPSADNVYDLGSPTAMWKDVYIGPGSLYVNGQKIVEADGADNIILSASDDQNLVLKPTGTGDIELAPGGSGAVQLKAPLQIAANTNILSQDGEAVVFATGVAASTVSGKDGDLTLSGKAGTTGIVRTSGDLAVSGDLTATSVTADIDASNLSGTVASARLGSGTADASTFLRGDGQWAVVDSTSLTVSGVAVVQASAFGLNIDGDTVADTIKTSTGGLEMTDATISGTGDIIVDPNGDNSVSGALRIKGDLVVDGNTTTVNTNEVSIADSEIHVASGAATDILTHGAGIKFGNNKTIAYNYDSKSLKSSEHVELASGKTFMIDGSEVLTASTVLGKSMPTGVVVGASDAQTLTSKTIDASANTISNIANSSLVNSTVSFGGVELALGATDATPAFNLADATNLPTTSLSGTITNAQLAGSISNDKLANNTISGHALGSALSTLTMSTGAYLTGAATYTGAAGASFAISLEASSDATADKVVVRDASGDFAAGMITANLTGDVTGNADTATLADDAINAANVQVDSSADADAVHYMIMTSSASGNVRAKSDAGVTYNPSTNTLTAGAFVGPMTGDVTGNADTATLAADSTLFAGEVKAYYATASALSDLETTVGLVTFSGAYGDLTGVPTNVSQFANDSAYLVSTDTIDNASEAATVSVAADNVSNTERLVTFVDAATGFQDLNTDVELTYNPGLDRLSATTFKGALEGNAATASKLASPVTIAGVAFDGSADIELPGVTAAGSQDTTGNAATASALAHTVTIGGLSTDLASGTSLDLPGVTSAGNQNTSGNAATATVSLTVSDAAQPAITSVGTLTGLTVSGDAEVGSNLTVVGDLTVQGNTTTISSSNLEVVDANITVAKGAADATAADGAGLTVDGADATFTYGSIGDTWVANKPIAANIIGDLTGNADTASSSDACIGNSATATALDHTVSIGGLTTDLAPGASLDLPGVTSAGTQDTSGRAAVATSADACSGNSASATVLATARTIGGVSFDGSASINLPGVNVPGNQDTSGNAATASALETPVTIAGVAFDGASSINLPGVNAVGNQDTTGNAATATVAASTSGNAATASKLASSVTIGGVAFDGSSSINLPGVNALGSQDTTGNAATATTLATARNIGGVSFNGSSSINLPGVNIAGNQNTSGNAATATKLAAPVTIAGVAFDGSADIELPGVTATGSQDTTGNAATATDAAQLGGQLPAHYLAWGNLTGVPALVTSLGSATLATSDITNDSDFTTSASVDTKLSTLGSSSFSIPGVTATGNQNTTGNALTATTAATATNALSLGGALASTFAPKSYVDTAISNLVGTAPAALDTLEELAAALDNDSDVITDILTTVGTKAPLDSPTFTGIVTATAFHGNVIGDIQGDLTGTFTGPVTGDVTGNVIGDLTGNVTGDLVGDVTGSVTGDVIGASSVATADLSASTATLGPISVGSNLVYNKPGGGTSNHDVIVDGTMRVTGQLDIGTATISLDPVSGQIDLDGLIMVEDKATGEVEFKGRNGLRKGIKGVARKIGGRDFDGTSDISLPGVDTAGTQDTSGNAASASGIKLNNNSILDGDDVASKNYVAAAILNNTPDLSTVLSIDGSNAMTGNLSGTTASFSGTVNAQHFNATSDITLKQDISVIDNALEMINNLNGISWNWKNDGTASMGVSAQDVEAVAPELVGHGEYKSVNYNGLVGVLIEAVKSLSAEVRELKNK